MAVKRPNLDYSTYLKVIEMSEPTHEGATDLGGGVDRINAILNPEQLPTEGETAGTEVEASAPETPQGDTEATEQMFTVKVGDEEREVSLDEMRKGYMMESDYRKKTTDVAERRKALEAKETEIDQRLSEAETLLSFEVDQLSSEEMTELKETDPDAYLKEFDRVNARVESFNQAKEKRNAEIEEQRKEAAHAEREALIRAVPEWLDSKVMAEEGAQVLAHAKDLGFNEAEISNMVDHRMLVLVRDSLRLKQIESQDISDKKVETPPKTQQPSAITDDKSAQSEQVKQLKSKLKKSGSMQDAARLFRSQMEE